MTSLANNFAMISTKAAMLKRAMDPIPAADAAHLPTTKIPFIDMDTTSEFARPDTTARPIPKLPPATPAGTGSRMLNLLRSRGGKIGMGATGLGALGLHLYNRTNAPAEQPNTPSLPDPQDVVAKAPLLVPPVRRLLGARGNLARESLRKNAVNTAKGALDRFVARMSAKYGLRQPMEPMS